MRWIGLFLSPLRRWQLSCRLFPCRFIPQICAPVARPPVCTGPVVSVSPIRVRPLCVFLTGLCFLLVFVSAPPFREILSSLSCRVVYTLLLFLLLPLPLPGLPLPLPLPLSCLRLPLPVPGLPLGSSSHAQCRACLWVHRPMHSCLGTVDPDCPSPTDPSEKAVCFFVFDLFHKFRCETETSTLLP